ncbi:hypothetical protein ACIQF6_28225 [Kitasatospora sp. NPDC092948]|uniref:hypothetical protein n=1 Tax=Kitasatospora sp. NPDC092948 TaxID=3364088 RepID=UPI003809A51B
MEIRIIDPTAEDLELLAPFLARHRDAIAVAPPRWTVALARDYYSRLPPRNKQVLRLLAHPDRDGQYSAKDLRAELGTDNLRGSTAFFRRTLTDGERTGRWPAGLPVPVESIRHGGTVVRFQITYHRDHPDLLEVFQAAVN